MLRRTLNILTLLSTMLMFVSPFIWLAAANPLFDINLGALIAMALFPILPILWMLSSDREDRRRDLISRGYCGACRYDMRGSYDTCPECGWVRGGGV